MDDQEHQKLPLHDAVNRLEQIREELMEITDNLHDSIVAIEDESLAKIKSDVKLRAENLDDEVMQLREELKVIKELLGLNLEKKKPDEKYV